MPHDPAKLRPAHFSLLGHLQELGWVEPSKNKKKKHQQTLNTNTNHPANQVAKHRNVVKNRLAKEAKKQSANLD